MKELIPNFHSGPSEDFRPYKPRSSVPPELNFTIATLGLIRITSVPPPSGGTSTQVYHPPWGSNQGPTGRKSRLLTDQTG